MSDHFQLQLTDTGLDLRRDGPVSASTRVDVTSRLGASTRVGVQVLVGPEDAPVKVDVSPRDFVLDDGATQSVDVAVEIDDSSGGGEPAAQTAELRVQAYVLERPQEQYTTSGPIPVSIDEIRPFPWWIVIAAGVGLLVVVGLVLFFLLRGGGGDGVALPSVIGQDLETAMGELAAAGDVTVHHLGVAEGTTEGVCVLYQTPPDGQEGDDVDIVVTGCPDEDVAVDAPADGSTLCSSVPEFCDALDEDISTTAEQQAVLASQTQQFVETFEVEGVEVPSLVTRELDEALELASVGGIDVATVPTDAAGLASPCVLYQVPFDGSTVAPDYTLTLVLAECPDLEEDAADVAVVPAALADIDDICPSLAGLCEDLGLTSADLAPRFGEYLETFRGAFSAHLVPEIEGKFVHRARSLLSERGLTLDIENYAGEDVDCFIVDRQLVPADTRADAVPGGTVGVLLQLSSPAIDPGGLGNAMDLRNNDVQQLIQERNVFDEQIVVLDPCLFFSFTQDGDP